MSRLGARGVRRAVGIDRGYLGKDVREPGLCQLMLVVPAGVRQGASGGDPWVHFFERLEGLRGLKVDGGLANLIGDILPGLNISSPLLAALDLDSEYGFADFGDAFNKFQNCADLAEIANTFSRLHCPDQQSAASLPRLKCIRFPVYYEAVDPVVLTAFMHNLASLRHPLRRVIRTTSRLESEASLATLLAACPTIQQLDICDCASFTDKTLVVLENHPPLKYLELSYLCTITTPAITSLLRKRGSQLRFLALDWIHAPPLEAMASCIPKLEYLVIANDSYIVEPVLSWEYVEDLVRAFPRLKAFAPERLVQGPDSERIQAFLDGLGFAHQAIDLLQDRLTDSRWYSGVGGILMEQCLEGRRERDLVCGGGGHSTLDVSCLSRSTTDPAPCTRDRSRSREGGEALLFLPGDVYS
ncbi:hypothetical protein BDK51DRAFT_48139 [Blyttiomyces helicus]|uniref:F-box domain-containing protein n=1 Tax=Blyttiomyces helicus TaxID=388810 RepID=A0A4P9W1R9_9FUNG|nr:hypothetical protein BDK51DRAFT_48139 [Blyttiomyces helicus]|eukprot:RKO85305.1 hypothetical protein BDK51DRAFT_48139 [Blyttiomyces helicus]